MGEFLNIVDSQANAKLTIYTTTSNCCFNCTFLLLILIRICARLVFVGLESEILKGGLSPTPDKNNHADLFAPQKPLFKTLTDWFGLSMTHFSQFKWKRWCSTGLFNTFVRETGRGAVTLATLYLLVSLYRCEKMVETGRKGGQADRSAGRQNQHVCTPINAPRTQIWVRKLGCNQVSHVRTHQQAWDHTVCKYTCLHVSVCIQTQRHRRHQKEYQMHQLPSINLFCKL